MKSMLENYHILIAMTIFTSFTILLKCLCAIKYQILMKETEQMSSSKNKVLRSMVTKYESCFKLQMPIKNTDSFVKVHLEHFRLFGIPLNSWEQFDWLCGFLIFFAALFNIMGGMYYELPLKWMLIQVMTFSLFLLFLGISEFIFQTRKKSDLFVAHLIHYFDNTLYTKLFQKYIQPDNHAAYLQEYFEAPPSEEKISAKSAATLEKKIEKKLAPDMLELMESLLAESKDKEKTEEEKEQLAHAASAEKYHLVEEIMSEYL